MAMADRSDDVSTLAVQTATTDFVDKVRTTGKLTIDDYDKYVSTISSTGNSFDVDLELQILDENPGVKTTQTEMTKIGENLYYNEYTNFLFLSFKNFGFINMPVLDTIKMWIEQRM